MRRRIKASWTAILVFALVGAGYLWMYRFEPLLSGEAGSDVFVWDRWRHRVCALTDRGEATELRCDNAMETDGGSVGNAGGGSDVSTRVRMRDTLYRKL
ncbi:MULTISPECIES: hypothetical protein [Ralstonia solanacearum species complex]|uniref:Uncharacterized protein n=3 Tax=Ralstonia solanacearum species complex TaxID=3116862 RepID=A0A223GVD1_9RALS|nr:MULTISPECIES: hypothetical protein [Ralstonia]AKZ29004.1 membrane protein [Ralstonia solanacearum]APF89606.1 hypothetical protein BCR16_22680 [Ralstonia solanacearum FJAT-1458]ARS58964.1 hypothetical protein BC427_22890 [Ralstonia solanacearum FJAT-91]ESS50399.1 hypothetical protein L665_04544 [Ralstonia solanacearum SD54]ANH36058.1 membrane protein [Ralstonia solanacearum]